MSDEYPIQFEAGLPNPTRIPAAPDELVAHIRQYHRGLERVTVKLYTGRKRTRQLNAIQVGAKQGQVPQAGVEIICRAIMAVCGEHYEETAQDCRFQIQAHVWLTSSQDVSRKSVTVELGEGGDVEADFRDPDKQVDQVLIGHIQECHSKIMELSDKVADIGRVAIENASAVFKAREDAMVAKAEAEATITQMLADQENKRARAARMDKLMGMLQGAVKEGTKQVAQHMAGRAQAALAGAVQTIGAGQVDAVPDGPAPGFQAPSWMAAGPSPAHAPSPSPTAAPSDTTEPMPEHAWAHVARTIVETISTDQWHKLYDVLTKTQAKLLRALGDVQTDDEAFAGVRDFQGKLKPDQQAKLLGVVTPEQIGLLLDLKNAADDAEKSDGDDEG